MNEQAEPSPIDAMERWDWDFYQEPPAPRRRWRVLGRIVWKGRSEPMPDFGIDEEILDWDAHSPPPPPKNRRKIQVQIRYKGRGKPLPSPDPDNEPYQ